jgi:uncharacterized membrane protein YfcA
MDWLSQLVLLVISLLANLFSALSGGGAGLIQLPVLIFLGLPFGVALATHKIATVALGIGATLRYLKSGGVERRFAVFILATGLPGVVLGTRLILQVPERAAQVTLGLLTIGLGVYSWLQPGLGQEHRPQHRDRPGHLIGGAVLFVVGVINGSLASGTGLFVTLWLIRWFGLDYKRAVAYTLILVGLFWNGVGALALGLQTPVRWDWLPALLVGSLLGGYLGAHIAVAQGNRLIKRAFEVITVLVGLKLVAG